MKVSRRDFLKWTMAATVALKMDFDMDQMNMALAAETDPPVIWLQGSGCSGCTISTLNVTNPATIDTVLTGKVSMKFNSTLMTSSGESALQALESAATQYKGQFILVVEGAIPAGTTKEYCVIGELNGVPMTMYDAVLKYGPMAKYVVASGTCASFGGVSATAPNKTACAPVKTVLTGKTLNPVINLPGCPVHPTVLVQTLIDLILVGMPAISTTNTPTKYFSTYIHEKCPRHESNEVSAVGLVGCYEELGCKGKSLKYNACPSMKWNNGRMCITSNHPCIGCASPSFPSNPLTK